CLGAALAQDPHHLRTTLGTDALSSLPAVLELDDRALELDLLAVLHAVPLVHAPAGLLPPAGFEAASVAASRHDAGACQARMQAHRGPIPGCSRRLRAVRCGTVAPSGRGRAYVGGRSEHRSAALGGTCVRAS